MHNTKFLNQPTPAEPLAKFDRTNSQYYLIVVQYTAKLDSAKINKMIKTSAGLGKKFFNFRLCPPEVNDELTGYSHNGVTPLGTTEKLPIIISDKIMQLAATHGLPTLYLSLSFI